MSNEVTWSWFGIEIHNPKFYYLTSKSDSSYYLYDYDPKVCKRTWTKDPKQCLRFESEAEINEIIEKYNMNIDDFVIHEVCK